MTSVSGLSLIHRVQARDRAVGAAMLGLSHAPNIHYTQDRPFEIAAQGRARRWEGIDARLNAKLGQYPLYADCSAFVTWCLWNGLSIPFGCRDTVNGAGWRGGYTGTLLAHGKQVRHDYNIQRADIVIYGNGGTGEHTAIVVGRRKSDGKTMCVSHGSEGGPYYVPIDYRIDIMQVRRAI
jgi:cell wall-associated NlpC family hydrolase